MGGHPAHFRSGGEPAVGVLCLDSKIGVSTPSLWLEVKEGRASPRVCNEDDDDGGENEKERYRKVRPRLNTLMRGRVIEGDLRSVDAKTAG